METRRRDKIQHSLRTLAESYRATMVLMEQTLEVLCEELALDSVPYLKAFPEEKSEPEGLVIEKGLLSVRFRGKVCFLGNTLPFKLLCRLARRPNTYVSYEELLSEVWEGLRTDNAVRSVVKSLRARLRHAGLTDLAEAIDGSVSGHYAFHLPGSS